METIMQYIPLAVSAILLAALPRWSRKSHGTRSPPMSWRWW